MRSKLLVPALIMLMVAPLSQAEGGVGIHADVSVSGFFSPEIKSFKILSVDKDSKADKAGLQAGNEILSIEDCKIPGCDAHKAKKLMKQGIDGHLQLLIKTAQGQREWVRIPMG